MGAANGNITAMTSKGGASFPSGQVARWDEDGAVHFAIAMARLTGWPLVVVERIGRDDTSVDVGKGEHVDLARLVCMSDEQVAFDPGGIMPVMKLLERRQEALTHGGRSNLALLPMQEEDLRDARVGLPCAVDEGKVASATETILANRAYMSFVELRPKPWIATDLLTKYFLGRCFAFAEALRREIGGEAVAMRPAGYRFSESGGGSLHACVRLGDGRLADVWGVRPAERVARAMGVADWTLSAREFADDMAEAVRVRGREDVEREIEQARAVVVEEWLPGIGGLHP